MQTLVLYLIGLVFVAVTAYFVDMLFATDSYVGEGVVKSKDTGQEHGMVVYRTRGVPYQMHYWRVTYTLDGQDRTENLFKEKFDSLKIGDRIPVHKRHGWFFEKYYIKF